MREKGEPALSLWQALLYRFHKVADPSWQVKMHLHEDNTTAIHCVRTGNHTMKTLERNFGTKISWMHDQVMGHDEHGTGTAYSIVHTGSKHMAADIYTKGFTDKRCFGNLRKIINVFTPKEIDSFAFSPDFGDEEVPEHAKTWLNPHYHFCNAGENTSTSDLRKPIKQKTPKAKSKFKVRPRAPGNPVRVSSGSDIDDDTDDEGATGGAVNALASSRNTSQVLQFSQFSQHATGGSSLPS